MYGAKAIPAGAYVRIIGMTNRENVDRSEEHRTYRYQPYWRRLSVAVAGSMVHFLLALALIFSFLLVSGKTEEVPSPDWDITSVLSNSPADNAGLLPGDRIVSVGDVQVKNFDE